MAAGVEYTALTALWPQLEDLVPPELPLEMANARLVALARSLLIENRQLRDVLAATDGPGYARFGHDGVEAA